MARLLGIAMVLSLLVATAAYAEVRNPDYYPTGCEDATTPDECMDSGGGGALGCLYCYMADNAPYANCFSGISGLPYPRYSNCNGTQLCYYDPTTGFTTCRPYCQGTACYTA